MIPPQWRLPHPPGWGQEQGGSGVAITYGDLRSNPPLGVTLTSGWTPMVNYAGSDVVPAGVVPNAANGTLQVPTPGVYVVLLFVDLSFTPLNAGRTLEARLFNTVNSNTSAEVNFYVGRDSEGADLTVSKLFTALAAGDTYRIEVSAGADTFANVVRQNISFGIYRVSEEQGGATADQAMAVAQQALAAANAAQATADQALAQAGKWG